MDTNLHVSRLNKYVKAEYCKQKYSLWHVSDFETFYLFTFPGSF